MIFCKNYITFIYYSNVLVSLCLYLILTVFTINFHLCVIFINNVNYIFENNHYPYWFKYFVLLIFYSLASDLTTTKNLAFLSKMSSFQVFLSESPIWNCTISSNSTFSFLRLLFVLLFLWSFSRLSLFSIYSSLHSCGYSI